jgi:hypothetical protein
MGDGGQADCFNWGLKTARMALFWKTVCTNGRSFIDMPYKSQKAASDLKF